jgi:hypothetical protein
LPYIELLSHKTFDVTEDDIEHYLEQIKGTYAFMVLSLLYPNINYQSINLDMDHIHPDSHFGKKKSNPINILNLTDKELEDWRVRKDKISNLQLMESGSNNEKRAKSIIEWLDILEKRQLGGREKFMEDNYFPNCSLEFSQFIEFYDKRHATLKDKLKNLLIAV